MDEYLLVLLKVVAAVIAAILTKYVVPALKTYIEDRRDQKIYQILETAITAAEQTIQGEKQGALKKQKVLATVTERLQQRGISITVKELEDILEAYIFNMNK